MKGVLLVSALAAFGVLGVTLTPIPPQLPGPETVRVPTGEIDYRPEGSFQNAGTAKTPAVQRITVPAFDIMQRQVSRGDYSECVADGACKETPRGGAGDAPQTHLNWYDARAYAAWLSIRTGERWRLPTDLEWQRAAAEGFGEASARSDGRDPGNACCKATRRGCLCADVPNSPAGTFRKPTVLDSPVSPTLSGSGRTDACNTGHWMGRAG